MHFDRRSSVARAFTVRASNFCTNAIPPSATAADAWCLIPVARAIARRAGEVSHAIYNASPTTCWTTNHSLALIPSRETITQRLVGKPIL